MYWFIDLFLRIELVEIAICFTNRVSWCPNWDYFDYFEGRVGWPWDLNRISGMTLLSCWTMNRESLSNNFIMSKLIRALCTYKEIRFLVQMQSQLSHYTVNLITVNCNGLLWQELVCSPMLHWKGCLVGYILIVTRKYKVVGPLPPQRESPIFNTQKNDEKLDT